MDLRAKRITLVARALTKTRDSPESAGMADVKDVDSMPTNLLELLISETMAIANSLAAFLQRTVSEYPPAFASTLWSPRSSRSSFHSCIPIRPPP
jgi:hypothetical protein